jgi:hypothetical protein
MWLKLGATLMLWKTLPCCTFFANSLCLIFICTALFTSLPNTCFYKPLSFQLQVDSEGKVPQKGKDLLLKHTKNLWSWEVEILSLGHPENLWQRMCVNLPIVYETQDFVGGTDST